MHIARRALAVLVAFATLAAPAPAAAKSATAGLDAFIKRALVQYRVPGASVAIVEDGRTVFLKGYGVRRAGEPGPVDENTVFQLASDTKTFTAAALAALVSEGKLDWDDEVITHLPEFVLFDEYATRNATVRDLLAHRTGLPAFTGDILGELGYDRAEALRRIRYLPPATSFREKPLYSNLGFFAAGMVAGRAAGSSWEDVVQSRLLTPLGMSRSGTSMLATPADDNHSATHGFIHGRIQLVLPSKQIVLGPAGSMISTASDLARYMRMLLARGEHEGRQVLAAKAVDEMLEPSMVSEISFSESAPISTSTGFGYAMGWGYYYFHGAKILEKGGALDGARALIVLVPERKLGIAVLANLNLTMLPEAIRAHVLEAALGAAGPGTQATILKQQEQLNTLIEPDPAPDNPGPASIPLAGYAGTYESGLYGRFTVTPDGDKLAVAAGPGGLRGSMTHLSRDTFTLTWPWVNYGNQETTFTIGPDGRAASFTAETLGEFTRIKAPGE
jgi:CubicO group peptidase (beta-lactamase class C family)